MKLVTNTVVTARNYRQLDRIVELEADFDLDHATFVTLVEYEEVLAPELHLTAEDRKALDGEIIPPRLPPSTARDVPGLHFPHRPQPETDASLQADARFHSPSPRREICS